jgi:hypothetical protein
MGSDKSSTSSGSLGARFLIILYSAGIVMLGLYPIQREYGSFWNFVDKKIIGADLESSYESIFRDLPRQKTAAKRQKDSVEKASWFSRKIAEFRDSSVNEGRERARMLLPSTRKIPIDDSRSRAMGSVGSAQSRGIEGAARRSQSTEHDSSPDNLDADDRSQLDSLFEKLP